ncbi:MAG: radical SAM protein [Clostridiales bacterium]|nr:radical SAM protein [Clostridiales bacterium]
MKKTAPLHAFFHNELRALFLPMLRAVWQRPAMLGYYLRFLRNQVRADARRRRNARRGLHIPPFLIMSVTKACNLRCTGCYSHAIDCGKPRREEMGLRDFARVFADADRYGIGIVMIAGGEPFMRREVVEFCAKFKNITFTVYTNGTLLNETDLHLLRRNKHIHIYFSLEGNETETDRRRGAGVYAGIAAAMEKLRERAMYFAVSVTVTSENLGIVSSDAFVADLVRKGCCYFNYVEFEAVEEGSEALRLNDAQRGALIRSLDRFRAQYRATLFAAFPGYEYKSGGCLAAGKGFFHINAYGDAEPCNFIPLSDTSVIGRSLPEVLDSPLFLKLRGDAILDSPQNNECALLARREELARIAGDI